jgi:phosphoribosylaminoimidazolecarboxamide formyltransferase/IMP cyclohydrolase
MPTAIVSLSDKSNLFTLVNYLVSKSYRIISSGGTYKAINDILGGNYEHLYRVENITGYPELLGGRVKTLHPIIHAGILASSDNPEHLTDLQKHNIDKIDLVAVNLYPFNETVSNPNVKEEDAIENIDIGGHTLLRAACKNYHDIRVLCRPTMYWMLGGQPNTLEIRRTLANEAWKHVTEYDQSITSYFTDNKVEYRTYNKYHELKYGCNPHQSGAAMYLLGGETNVPFHVINGQLGYINVLDAVNAWGLVCDLGNVLNTEVAASFKHTSPAGVGIGYLYDDDTQGTILNPLSEYVEYFLHNHIKEDPFISSVSSAYIRARSGDPMSSFGDFIAVFGTVDEQLAGIIKREISDGIIASGYTETALEILKTKKSGKFIILEGDTNYMKKYKQLFEYREIGGLCIKQRINRVLFDTEEHLVNIPTINKELSYLDKVNLLIANTSLKYTQSNSVAYARDSQIIGVGAGQQSRVDCVKLAGGKADKWWLRNHPKVQHLLTLFRPEVRRQERINAVIRYIEGDFTEIEYHGWCDLFVSEPEELTMEDKREYLKTLQGVSMASDAFFPFRDNIDHASKHGVRFIVQPGGSVADEGVINACNDYEMVMCMSGVRVFTH